MQKADFTQNSMQNAMRNLSAIQAQSMRKLPLPNPCSIPCSKISGKFHADFTQKSMQNVMQNLSGIQVEAVQTLPMSNPCLIPCSKQILRKFHAEFDAQCYTESTRNPNAILAESKRNPCGIYPCLIHFILCSKQISSKFYAAFTLISHTNLSGIYADS